MSTTTRNNGIITKAKEAVLQSKLASYKEEIRLAITEAKLEGITEKNSDKAFIELVKEKLENKNWVSLMTLCDDSGVQQEDNYFNTVITIDTTDDLEIYVNIDNDNEIASISENIITASNKNICAVTFNANGGNGDDYSINAKKEFYTTLPENTFTNDYCTFVGWSEDKNGNDTIYSANSKYKASNNTTLYAIWQLLEDVECNFDYTGGEQTFFTAQSDGIYKLEVWGAQGGTPNGGYGAYSVGVISAKKNQTLYINVGGQGSVPSGVTGGSGGYNGGGNGGNGYGSYVGANGGGGATHISTKTGILSSLENNIESILIVAGGGGGSVSWVNTFTLSGGNAGGISGNAGKSYYAGEQIIGASQITGYAFGQGKNGRNGTAASFGGEGAGGGGGGLYGGFAAVLTGDGTNASGAGGSGYIGNESLTNKAMYGYSIETSSDEDTLTYSTTNVSETPTSGYAKIGNGYAKITYLGKE